MLTPTFITQDPATLGMLSLAGRAATTEVTVLILGESGTGKELVARYIHQHSTRARSTMVSINCGAIQETLLLSELFGHEKGAFTGAVHQKKGLVEVADCGTLFLDEIGEMGFEAQAKLLRFLQEGEIYRVGGQAPIKVNVRIVAATNRDLSQQVKDGKFREDLFYRINTVSLQIPPLRKRPADIPLLIQNFLKEDSLGNPKKISLRALDLLKKYSWPGNIRELQNIVERLKILVESDTINEEDVPINLNLSPLHEKTAEEPEDFLLANIEKKHIIRVLDHFKGNKTRAAQAMGITVKTLYNKLAQYEEEKQRYPVH